MSIPASGERKLMVVLTSPAVFVFWLRHSVSPTIVPLLFYFYIIVWPSFVFHSPKFPTVFSPFSLLLFLTLFLSLYFCPPPLLGSVLHLAFIVRGRRRFLVTAGVHHGGEEHRPRDAPPLDCSSVVSAANVSLVFIASRFI